MLEYKKVYMLTNIFMWRLNPPEAWAWDVTPPIEMLKNNSIDTNLDNLEQYVEEKLKVIDSRLEYWNWITIQPEFDLTNKDNNQLFLKINWVRLNIAFTYSKEWFDALTNAYWMFLNLIDWYLKSDLHLRNSISPIDFSSEKSIKWKITWSKQNHIYADWLTLISPDTRLINFSDFKKWLNLQGQNAEYINNLQIIFVKFLNQVKDKLPQKPTGWKNTIQT